jgi:hypothetical protein
MKGCRRGLVFEQARISVIFAFAGAENIVGLIKESSFVTDW